MSFVTELVATLHFLLQASFLSQLCFGSLALQQILYCVFSAELSLQAS